MEKNETNNTNVAGRIYSAKDYHKSDEVSKGFAQTHEQASDTMTVGTIDGVMENVAGKDIPLQKDRLEKK
ncbi:YozQ family protein [Niallia sp. 03133]|uniref:YozQ family protein n=1 Tax=Niallia sp. 03133 TaxID=3458060 RepID=UPI004043C0EB